MMIDKYTIIKNERNIEYDIVDDEMIMYDEGNDEVYMLNQTSSALWTLIMNEPQSYIDYDALCEKYYDLFNNDKPEYTEFIKDFDKILSGFIYAKLIKAYKNNEEIIVDYSK